MKDKRYQKEAEKAKFKPSHEAMMVMLSRCSLKLEADGSCVCDRLAWDGTDRDVALRGYVSGHASMLQLLPSIAGFNCEKK